MQEQDMAEASRAIGFMLRGWLGASSKIDPMTVKTYLSAVRDIDLPLIVRACQLLNGGFIDRDNDFAPSAAKLAEVARSMMPAPRRAEPMLPLMAPEIGPEERARVHQGLLDLAAQHERRHHERLLPIQAEQRAKMRERNDRLVARDPRPIEERLKLNGER